MHIVLSHARLLLVMHRVQLLVGAELGPCQALAAGKRAHCAGLQALDAKQFTMTTLVYNAFLKVGVRSQSVK